MKTKLFAMLLCLGLVCALLAGCGTTTKQEAAESDTAAPAEAMRADGAGINTLSAASADTALTPPEGRKWIVTVNLTAETEDLDSLTQGLNQKIQALGGYVEDQHIHNGSAYAAHRYRSASLTVRIPAEQVDSFTAEVAGMANVVSQEKNLEDITLRYVATESRLAALEAEQKRLMELLEQAETMADLLEIEQRLTDVRYELENAASQKRLFDNQIDYATIYLELEEVQEYTPVEEPGLWQRISGGFMDSLKGLGRHALDLVVWVLAYSPYLAVLGGLGWGTVALIRRSRRRKAEKKANSEKK